MISDPAFVIFCSFCITVPRMIPAIKAGTLAVSMANREKSSGSMI